MLWDYDVDYTGYTLPTKEELCRRGEEGWEMTALLQTEEEGIAVFWKKPKLANANP